MSLTGKQVEYLARTIVNRLEDRGLVEFGDAEAGIDIVQRILEDNFRIFEQIQSEAHGIVAARTGREPNEIELAAEMRRIAEEKNFII